MGLFEHFTISGRTRLNKKRINKMTNKVKELSNKELIEWYYAHDLAYTLGNGTRNDLDLSRAIDDELEKRGLVHKVDY